MLTFALAHPFLFTFLAMWAFHYGAVTVRNVLTFFMRLRRRSK